MPIRWGLLLLSAVVVEDDEDGATNKKGAVLFVRIRHQTSDQQPNESINHQSINPELGTSTIITN